MNCIEALANQTKVCELCLVNAIIIEFEDLPEHEKYNFDHYEPEKHFLIYCKPCDKYKILPEPFEPNNT